ncbi:MAG: hypothetical protein IPN74_10385 [Haliscomenobacter sp.]|nr:hypothetical protein [Haliscomenobacter sp.]
MRRDWVNVSGRSFGLRGMGAAEADVHGDGLLRQLRTGVPAHLPGAPAGGHVWQRAAQEPEGQVAAQCDAIVEDFDAPKDNCCGEVDYELDLACLVGGDKCAAPTAEEMLRLFKTKLRIQDSLDCVTDRGYAFFARMA